MNRTDKKSKPIFTIWSRNEIELIPERIRTVIVVVMPIIYIIMALFGIISFLVPIQTFISAIGVNYGYIWAALIGLFSIFSLISLIFKSKLELYSTIILSILLAIYPIYVVINDASDGVLDHPSGFFGAVLYLVMPCWRVFDISRDIRKSQRRQLYSESLQGEQ